MVVEHLHIISLNVPFPANYGGVIDIYYRAKALAEAGVKVHLHCFVYNRAPHHLLEDFCFSVNYYNRNTSILSAFSSIPYIVKSRESNALLQNLLKDDYPILFEGLHTTLLLNRPELRNRVKIVRAHNCEHEYYRQLFNNERNWLKKIYFYTESKRLRSYEKVLHNAQLIASISKSENRYFNDKYGKSVWLPPAHSNNNVTSLTGIGKYVLFHADLSLLSNELAAKFVVESLRETAVNVVIAGRLPSKNLQELVEATKNVRLIVNPDAEAMDEIVANAHIIVLPTFHKSGVKLKLIDSLYKGRHCIANNMMLDGTDLDDLVMKFETEEELRLLCHKLQNVAFTENDVDKRRVALNYYDNNANAKKLLNAIENIDVRI
ncbi:MAG: glycosyltransferase family 1 protein [Salinivirgaceae bacterium]|nr:glycosyltransferase family 1 protein [Salinivirgaceae bacterium]